MLRIHLIIEKIEQAIFYIGVIFTYNIVPVFRGISVM